MAAHVDDGDLYTLRLTATLCRRLRRMDGRIVSAACEEYLRQGVGLPPLDMRMADSEELAGKECKEVAV